MIITIIQGKIYTKGEYLTYLVKYPYSYLYFVIIILFASRIIILIPLKEESILKKIKSNKIIFFITSLITYIIFTSVVVVTEDGIYDYNFYNLKSKKYSFSDVKYVDTGFVEKGRNKGEFFYNIELKDGKKLKLSYPSLTQPSDKYDNDTWQEYIDIDKYIMNSGAKKESSEKASKYVKMDKIYVDKLLKVIRNK